jgi:hypothetical protein
MGQGGQVVGREAGITLREGVSIEAAGFVSLAATMIAWVDPERTARKPALTFARCASWSPTRCATTRGFSFDYFGGGNRQRLRHGDTERPCSMHVDDELELR